MNDGNVPSEALNSINEIIAILSRIIITCKKNINSGK
jgi:hypothetical protein